MNTGRQYYWSRDGFYCTGNEEVFKQCSYSTWRNADCAYARGVQVQCSHTSGIRTQVTTDVYVPKLGDLRQSLGYLQAYWEGSWQSGMLCFHQ